jgi:hypothetical protein
MSTPIRGRDPITAADALAVIRAASPHDVNPYETVSYVAVLVSLCGEFGLRPTVLLAQWHHETAGGGPSGRWRELNPAGLGITNANDATPYRITSGGDAARLHVWTMLVALREWDQADRIKLPPAASSWMQRWQRKYADPGCPAVNTIEDLNLIYQGDRATWAVDPAYHTKLLATMRRLFPATGESENAVSVTFGRVPHPAFQDRPITKPEGVGQNNLGKRSVKGVVWHRILGSLWGTDTYFRRSDVKALTDYGVGVLATDGTANAGVILRWNNPLGYQSGWASGSYSAFHAYGDGAAFAKKYGINAVNRDQVSIEISGFQTTPLDEASRNAVAALTAYWADQYGIPWNVFPIAPQDGFSFVRWHEEFGPDLGAKKCPFDVVKRETNDLIERTRAILKRWQENPEIELPEEEPQPDPEPEKHTIPDGHTFESLRRLYGRFIDPTTGIEERFDLNTAPSQVWLAYGKKSGLWPKAQEKIRRGNGNQLYRWEGGFSWERKA